MKNIKKDKKGFTLIELLAVIVVLAVIILLAASNIGGLSTTAKKNVLAVEGNTLIDGAKNAYQIAVLNGQITTGNACFSLEYLYQEGYFTKGSADGYAGSVYVDSGTDGKVFNYYFWINDKSYIMNKADGAKLGATGTTAQRVEGTTKASEVCGSKAKKGDGMFGYDSSNKKSTFATKS